MTLFDLEAIGRGLPAAALVPQLEAALRSGRRAVIEAPPGSGKTTLVPPTLANVVAAIGPHPGRVIVAQPRRIAARAGARRLATLSGTRLGQEVGFSVRGESQTSRSTRVEFVTAGLLLRRLLSEPDLPGVSAIVLDEVHERDLDADLAFALVREVADLRDDLAVSAMSATLDTARWATLLGEGTPVLSVPMVPHPLTVEWAPAAGPRLDARGVTRAFLTHVAETTARAMAAHPEGSALVFLPGAREVDEVTNKLRAYGIDALPLTGSLGAREQDAALTPPADGHPRAIVATSVAESSLTVPDVRLVVDSCLAREPRLDLDRDLSGLVTVSVSRASGEQRAGRAARLGPGTVVRCVSQAEWAAFPVAARPEIATADLTAAALTLALWGAPGGAGLALPDAPSPAALGRAHATLAALGAIAPVETTPATTRIEVTARGRALAQVPAHPRLARALLDGAEQVGSTLAAELVAAIALDERADGADLTALLRRLRQGQTPAAARWRQDARRLASLIPQQPPQHELTGDAALAYLTALAHPERIARARGQHGSYQLAGGTGAALPKGSSLAGQPWLAIADVTRGFASDGSGAVIRAAVPISESLALDAAAPLRGEVIETQWREGRVSARKSVRLGAIELSSTPVPAPPQAAREAVAAALARDGLASPHWSPAAEQLRRRLALVHRILGDPWPAMDDAALLTQAESWLAPELDALASGKPASRLDLHGALQRLLPWPDAASLDELAPTHLEVPSGSRIAVDYPEIDETDAPPVLAVKLQECFGWEDTPRLVRGRVPVLLHLLSPARRPLAVTDDLSSFWSNAYAQVRAEMRGRYPKHPWPEDPRTAPARRGTTKSGK